VIKGQSQQEKKEGTWNLESVNCVTASSRSSMKHCFHFEDDDRAGRRIWAWRNYKNVIITQIDREK